MEEFGGELVAGDGVSDVVGDCAVGAEACVAGQVEADGEFFAGADGEFDRVAGDVLADGDGGGVAAGEVQGCVAGGVDAAAVGAYGEVGAADVEGFLAVAVAEA
ncbi:hypothetical protein [Streptomyces sp. NRRL S-646]|uniref:hypothetical protein n=1 Tax=Streptomyces sp. NRRL S-646 TaxID=1463917 RepID=UPI0004C58291|nr:hypothetical protein [Streptomyces sp. NRRL S-646]